MPQESKNRSDSQVTVVEGKVPKPVEDRRPASSTPCWE